MGFSCLRFLSRLFRAGLGIVPFRRTLRHLRPYTFKQASRPVILQNQHLIGQTVSEQFNVPQKSQSLTGQLAILQTLSGESGENASDPFTLSAGGQLACRNTSSTAAGCSAMTDRKSRVGASGCDLPCSQLRKVAGGKPNLVANFAWLSPIFRRTLRTSTWGTLTSVTRTLSFLPSVHAIASFSPWIILAPTV